MNIDIEIHYKQPSKICRKTSLYTFDDMIVAVNDVHMDRYRSSLINDIIKQTN